MTLQFLVPGLFVNRSGYLSLRRLRLPVGICLNPPSQINSEIVSHSKLEFLRLGMSEINLAQVQLKQESTADRKIRDGEGALASHSRLAARDYR